MKNIIKFWGITALAAVIGFSMIGCEQPKDQEFPSELRGTWERNYMSPYTNTLTFSSNTLRDSTQNYYWQLKDVSGDIYTIKSSDSSYTTTINLRIENGNLRISGDDAYGEHDWDGEWRKRANGGDPGSGGGINPTINIRNNTGYTLSWSYIKPSTSTNWGSDVGPSWADGESKTITLSQPLSVQRVYDIKLSQGSYGGPSGYKFIKYGVTISNGMTIIFTTSDLDNETNLPTITIKNRSGKSFDSFQIKPSSSSVWNTDLGGISNNTDRTVTIPIPPSNYTVFDIQMKSSNPTNTYTRNNVTITNNMILIFTSADADNPTIELPVIVIENKTGYTLSWSYIKPSGSIDWGNDIGPSWADGDLITITLSRPLSEQRVYDIRLSQGSYGGPSGYKFTKYNVSVSEGMIVTFTASDNEP